MIFRKRKQVDTNISENIYKKIQDRLLAFGYSFWLNEQGDIEFAKKDPINTRRMSIDFKKVQLLREGKVKYTKEQKLVMFIGEIKVLKWLIVVIFSVLPTTLIIVSSIVESESFLVLIALMELVLIFVYGFIKVEWFFNRLLKE